MLEIKGTWAGLSTLFPAPHETTSRRQSSFELDAKCLIVPTSTTSLFTSCQLAAGDCFTFMLTNVDESCKVEDDDDDWDDDRVSGTFHWIWTVDLLVNYCGCDELEISDWLFGQRGLLLTEGGTCAQQPPIVLTVTPPTQACLPSFEARA